MDEDWRQVLQEAEELDHIWRTWEDKNGVNQRPSRESQVASLKEDMRQYVSVHTSLLQQWKSPSAFLIEEDSEVIPNVDIASWQTLILW